MAPATVAGQRVREQVRTAPLAEHADDLAAPGGAAAEGAAERLAEGRRDDVDAPHGEAVVLPGAASRSPQKAGGVAVVDQDESPMAVRQVADLRQGCDVAVHGEDAVGDDQPESGRGGLLELRLEVAHVGVLVDEALRLAEANAVDDRGVVQLVGEDGVLGAQKGLEDAAVGVEARGVEDRVLHAEELRDPLLQLEVQRLGPADEAHARHPEAPVVQGAMGRGDQLGVAGEAEVVVRAEIEDGSVAAADPDLGALVAQDRPLLLEEALLADLIQLPGEELTKSRVHGAPLGARRPRRSDLILASGWSRPN